MQKLLKLIELILIKQCKICVYYHKGEYVNLWVLSMNRQELLTLLKSIYNWPIPDDTAWSVYNNFLEIFMTEDAETMDYLYNLVESGREERLRYRNRIAELGHELRPDELNQYIFLIVVAMSEYIELENI